MSTRHAAVGWVHQANYTLRWRRGDAVAYVFRGARECPDSGEGAIDTISVNPAGWTDLAQIRRLLECWLEHNSRPPGAVSHQATSRGGRR